MQKPRQDHDVHPCLASTGPSRFHMFSKSSWSFSPGLRHSLMVLGSYMVCQLHTGTVSDRGLALERRFMCLYRAYITGSVTSPIMRARESLRTEDMVRCRKFVSATRREQSQVVVDVWLRAEAQNLRHLTTKTSTRLLFISFKVSVFFAILILLRR